VAEVADLIRVAAVVDAVDGDRDAEVRDHQVREFDIS